jgi:hypothetical protein
VIYTDPTGLGYVHQVRRTHVDIEIGDNGMPQ